MGHKGGKKGAGKQGFPIKETLLWDERVFSKYLLGKLFSRFKARVLWKKFLILALGRKFLCGEPFKKKTPFP